MDRVALKVAYIGTNFYGFQRQPNRRTVEEELLKAFKKANIMVDPKKSEYSIAGRTDRGVHAIGNVVSFVPNSEVIVNQLNDYLANEIKIIGTADVPNDFKPRFAESRFYRYVLVDEPFSEGCLDLDKMVEASKIFVGTHNFHNFSKRNQRTPIRTVNDVKILEKHGLILVDVEGESFLWNMVRKMVRILLNVGTGEMKPNNVKKLLDHSSQAAILPMPPEGLILMDVEYSGVEFKYNRYAKKKFIKTLKTEYLQKKTLAAVQKEIMENLMGD
jgi:tRNA pseudouridine38-40 synthase